MAIHVLMDVIVDIVCGQRRDTKKKQQQKVGWEDAYYTNNYSNHTVSNVPDGVGRKKRVAEHLSLEKY